ncbi:MAG: glycosyltransferase [Burkholderiales bacterium]|nr:glycosyltransferase [Burkholderiales bacterium]
MATRIMTNLRPRVGIHLKSFPIPSEAFVIEQARTLVDFEPEFLVRELLSTSTGFRVRAISSARRRRLFALLPGAWAFGGAGALQGFSLIHAHFGPNGVYGLPISQKLGIPLVVTFHGFDATVSRNELLFRSGLFGLQYMLRLSQLMDKGARFIAVSDFLHGKLLAMGMPGDKLVRHYIGVDLARFTPLPEAQRLPDIVCVGRLVAAKGIADLIEAFARIAVRFPDTRLRLVGAGKDRPAFERLVQERALQARVVFEGTMPHDQVAALVGRCAISVLASKTGSDGWQEAFGLASIEAAAAGLPVVVTRHGGLPETVVEGVTGLVVPEGGVDELADVLSQLLDSDSLRSRMGIAARRHVEKNFNLILQTQELERIYRGVLKK